MNLLNNIVRFIFCIPFVFLKVQCSFRREVFYGNIQDDQLKYIAIDIPRNALSVQIKIWTRETRVLPSVILRYDALPTLLHNDAQFLFEPAPFYLILADYQPTASTLYIGIWGGKLLHSNRYFAGSPSPVFYAIESLTTVCDNGLQLGFECDTVKLLPFSVTPILEPSFTDIQAVWSETVSYAYFLPGGLEAITVGISAKTVDLSKLCPMLVMNEITCVEMEVILYLDQPEEAQNSGSKKMVLMVDSVCPQNASLVQNTSSVQSDDYQLDLIAEHPLPGLWKLDVTLFDMMQGSMVSGNAARRRRSLRATNGLGSVNRPKWRAVISNDTEKSPIGLHQSLNAATAKKSKTASSKILQGLHSQRILGDDMPCDMDALEVALSVSVSATVATCPAGFTGATETFEVFTTYFALDSNISDVFGAQDADDLQPAVLAKGALSTAERKIPSTDDRIEIHKIKRSNIFPSNEEFARAMPVGGVTQHEQLQELLREKHQQLERRMQWADDDSLSWTGLSSSSSRLVASASSTTTCMTPITPLAAVALPVGGSASSGGGGGSGGINFAGMGYAFGGAEDKSRAGAGAEPGGSAASAVPDRDTLSFTSQEAVIRYRPWFSTSTYLAMQLA